MADQVIDHSGCVPAGIHTVGAHTHEGQKGYWLFRNEAISRGVLQVTETGQPAPEIPFPVISTHDKGLLLQFTTFEDRTAFKAWLLSPGWQEFLDSRRR